MLFSRLSKLVRRVRGVAISRSGHLFERDGADLISLTFGVGPREVDGKKVDGFGYYETIA